VREILLAIGGKRLPAADGTTMDVRSPATGELVARMACASPSDVDAAVAAAAEAGAALAELGPRGRARLAARVADLLWEQQESIARDLASEQGKPIGEARGEIAAAVEMWRDAAELVRHRTEEILPSDDPDRAIVVRRRPHGVLAVVTPWNFPATIPTEYLCAGLAMGNAIVWKPSELTPVTADRILRCIEEAGFPAGAVNLVTGTGGSVGAALVGHRGVNAVGFTGSPETGEAISRSAGTKPLLLELGGNNATVVLPETDISRAADALAEAAFANAGQICSSTERILVHASIHDDLRDALAQAARSRRVGPSLDETTQMGPLNNAAVLEKVQRHVREALDGGAVAVAGGRRLDGAATELFYEPTVLSGVRPDLEAFTEETFGPVAMLVPFTDDAQAVRMVNDHRLGLIAGIIGDDLDRALEIGRRLEVGMVNVDAVATAWQPHTPFGGFSGRRSGVGRLGGAYTLDALSQLQTFVLPARRLP
jgi:succinate-semialdehyde dehydrogenase/glutarate-semialdehyde dehydrogenase